VCSVRLAAMKMADFKGYLLHWYACCQKTNQSNLPNPIFVVKTQPTEHSGITNMEKTTLKKSRTLKTRKVMSMTVTVNY